MESSIYEWIECKPHEALCKYIDAYWISSTNSLYIPTPKKIFPDGCTELFANTGSNTLYLNETIAIKPGVIYAGGTLTESINFSGIPNSNFYGIRFRPGGFNTFFKIPLYEFTGQYIELPVKELKFMFNYENLLTAVTESDAFFLRRLNTNNERFISITRDLYLANGGVSVGDLSKRHHIGFRSLERLFKNSIGVSPRELSKIIRFQSVLKRLKDKRLDVNLQHLAFDLGYYDQAHLANEIKKFTGFTPSELRSYFFPNQK